MNTQNRYPQSFDTFRQRKPAEFLSIGKAAELLGVSIQTIRRWDRSGKISSIRSPGGHRYFNKRDLKKLFDKKPSNLTGSRPNLKIATEHKAPIKKRMEKKVRKNRRNRKNGENKKKSFSIKKTFIFLLIFFVSMDFILVLFYFFARNSALQVPYF